MTQTETPNNQLSQQFLSLVKADPKLLPVVLSWLRSHQDYCAADFWQQQDVNGEHVLFSLFNTNMSSSAFLNFLPIWRQEVGPQLAQVLFDTPNRAGQVLLHSAWSRRAAQQYDAQSEEKIVFDVMSTTNQKYWLWKDAGDVVPGSGWVSDIVRLMKNGSSNHNADQILSALTAQFPQQGGQVSSPSKSPWLKAESAPQIQALLDLGFSPQDPVKVGRAQMPAWQWLLSTLMSDKKVVELLVSLELPGIDDILKSAKNFSHLVATDRRAKKGYVEKILNHEGSDWMGRNALRYLFHYRRDLLDLWDDTVGEDLKLAQVSEKDLAGYTIFLHALISESSSLTKLLDIAKRHNIPVEYGVEDTGWWMHEDQASRWWKQIRNFPLENGYFHQLRKVGLPNLASLDQPGSFFWGTEADQERWSAWWEKRLPQLSSIVTVLNKQQKGEDVGVSLAQSLMACRQALLFALLPEKSRQDLSPVLSAQLQCASVLITGMAASFHNFWSTSLGVSADHLRNKGEHLVKPPSHFTPQMHAILADPSFEMKIHYHWVRKDQVKDIQAAWRAHSESHQMHAVVGGLAPATSPKRKM